MTLGDVLRRALLLVIFTLASSPQDAPLLVTKVMKCYYIFLLHLLSKIIAEVDVPELLLLASHLKPEECAKIVSFDSHPPLTKEQIKKSSGEQDCFQLLVKWICQWRTVTRNTYPILKDRLKFIGRNDLIPCLIDARIQSTMSPKMIREVQSFNEAKHKEKETSRKLMSIRSPVRPRINQFFFDTSGIKSDDDSPSLIHGSNLNNDLTVGYKLNRLLNLDSISPAVTNEDLEESDTRELTLNSAVTRDYDEMSTPADTNAQPKLANDTKPPVSNNTIDRIDGHTSIRLRLKSAGIILIVTILLTCCCTLFVRNKCAKLFNKIRGKKKKSKFVIMASEDGRDAPRDLSRKKLHKKRKRAPSYDMVHTATQNSVALTPREPEEASPTGCYRCYKKKRKKSGKRPRR